MLMRVTYVDWQVRRPGTMDASLRLVIETTVILPILCPIIIGSSNDGPKCLILCRDIAFACGVYLCVGVASIHPEFTFKGVSSSQFTDILHVRAEHLADADLI
jgi:hypothetical protein